MGRNRIRKSVLLRVKGHGCFGSQKSFFEKRAEREEKARKLEIAQKRAATRAMNRAKEQAQEVES